MSMTYSIIDFSRSWKFAAVAVLDVVAVAVLDLGWFCWLAMALHFTRWWWVVGTPGRDETPEPPSLLLPFPS